MPSCLEEYDYLHVFWIRQKNYALAVLSAYCSCREGTLKIHFESAAATVCSSCRWETVNILFIKVNSEASTICKWKKNSRLPRNVWLGIREQSNYSLVICDDDWDFGLGLDILGNHRLICHSVRSISLEGGRILAKSFLHLKEQAICWNKFQRLKKSPHRKYKKKLFSKRLDKRTMSGVGRLAMFN